MFDIKKFPIIIISGSRTGSTALAFELKNKYNLEVFSESFSNIGGSDETQLQRKKLLSLIKNKQNNFVLKVHQHDLFLYPDEIHKIINDNQCYLIRLRRKDIASQCVSLYIERQRNHNLWVYFKHYTNEKIDALKNTSMVIDDDMIIKCINDIIARNDKLNQVDYTIDQNVWYEDLRLEDDTFIITPKPNNYDKIKEKVETFLKHGSFI